MSEEGQGGTAGAQEEKGVNRANTQVEKRTSESMSYGTTRATRVVFVYPFNSADGSSRRVIAGAICVSIVCSIIPRTLIALTCHIPDSYCRQIEFNIAI